MPEMTTWNCIPSYLHFLSCLLQTSREDLTHGWVTWPFLHWVKWRKGEAKRMMSLIMGMGFRKEVCRHVLEHLLENVDPKICGDDMTCWRRTRLQLCMWRKQQNGLQNGLARTNQNTMCRHLWSEIPPRLTSTPITSSSSFPLLPSLFPFPPSPDSKLWLMDSVSCVCVPSILPEEGFPTSISAWPMLNAHIYRETHTHTHWVNRSYGVCLLCNQLETFEFSFQLLFSLRTVF